MASNEQIIWQFFKKQGFTDAGIAGLMGNFYAESCFSPINLQNSYEQYYGTDSSYTERVDSGAYRNFKDDGAGYGLAQWTYNTRKQNLLNFAKQKGTSIGDLNMQLEFVMWELNTSEFSHVLSKLQTSNSILEVSNYVLFNYEMPKDQGTSTQSYRANQAQKYYDQFVNGIYDVSINVPQIDITKHTSTHNTSSAPNRSIKYIVIHYTAGVNSSKGAAVGTANYFASTEVAASSDFIVDDETIVQYNPDIKNRRTWHCGGGRQSSHGGSVYGMCTNSNSIGIEVCSTNDTGTMTNANDKHWSYTDAVVNQTVLLTQYLMATYNISIDNVVRHFDVTGKFCPGIIGWNSATGDESKWLAFKNRLKSNISFDQNSPSISSVAASSYGARVIMRPSTNCYKEPDSTSELVRTYELNSIIAIAKQEGDWGYTGSGWVHLDHIQKISISEAIIEHILNGYDQLKFDPNSGEIIYPLESWNRFSNGGFKFMAHDEILNMLFEIRACEVEKSNEITLSNEEFVKTLILTLENSASENKEQCQEKIQLMLKSAAFSKNSLLSTTNKIIVKTAANALTDVPEEQILEKLDNSKEDIINYFREEYDEEGWNKNIKTAPETLNFWFDFMNTDGEMGKYSVKAIGSRSKAVNNDKITAIYFQETPSVMFMTNEQYEKREEFNDMTGYTFIQLQPFMENYFNISGQGRSAKDELDSLLYQHTNFSEQTTLTAIPIYHLQPNSRVLVRDDNTGLNGEYIVNKITIPLQYNGTTSITASKAVERIY